MDLLVRSECSLNNYVTALGYGIFNGCPIDSSEYQIKILKNGNNSSNNPKPLVFGDPVEEGKKVVTKPSSNKQPAQRDSLKLHFPTELAGVIGSRVARSVGVPILKI